MRDRFGTADFSCWEEHSFYDESAIADYCAVWSPWYKSVALYYYIQYHLHVQLSEVKEYAHRAGVVLKGDIPIGISRTSVDAWVNPQLFHMDSQAGAPPDDFSIEGQNWGFPTYNWEVMARDGYAWWKARLRKMSEYFNAYRIDHILGFFRIWEIPFNAVHGLLGHFNPALPFSPEELQGYGFRFDASWQTVPYIREDFLDEIFGAYTGEVKERFLVYKGDGRWDLNVLVDTQRKIVGYFSGASDDARPGYFLKGIEGTRKVSYAASIARDRLSDKEASAMIPLIEKFDFISVREKTAKKILDGYLKGKKSVYEVLDPALMRTREQWSEFIGTERYETEPYALMFFFSDSSAYRSRIEAYCHNHGLKLIGIPHAATYIKSDEAGNYEKAYDVGPVEFLRLFRDASYVFTDSFHGSAFSIIFQRQFCVFERDKNTKTSKNSRLYDLLAKFQVSDRLVRNAEDVDDVLRKEIDYLKVNAILEKERTTSGEFLKSALGHCEEKQKKKEVTVADFQKKSCCGCGLCAQVCPKKCIELRQDNEGFYYPVVNQDECIKCGLCVQKCVQTMQNDQTLMDAYIGYNPDESVRKDSSSGGIFNAIASAFIDNGGVVFGAAFDDDYSVRHVRIENKENLSRIMKSKYVQSDLKYIFDVLAEDLKKGRPVLFTGTPCQVAAVCQFADGLRLREKLYTIDFICHGIPSPGVWKSYLNYISKGSEVHEVNFRDKSHAGWHDYYLHIKYGDNSQLNESHELNTYMRLFLSDKNIRPACYYCNFKSGNYMSDLTLADAWKIEKEYEPWADDKGTSLFIIRSHKGEILLASCDSNLKLRKSNYEFWSKMNPSLVTRTQVGGGRKKLFSDFSELDESAFWKKYSPIPRKKKIRYIAKKVAKVTGIEKALRKRV